MTENCELKTDNGKNVYVFVLGRETKIALLELEKVLRRFGFGFAISNLSKNLAFINIDNRKKFNSKEIIQSLGGTIKIFEIIGETSRQKVVDDIENLLLREKRNQIGKLKFGISNYVDDLKKNDINGIGIKIKMALKKDFSVRYLENKKGRDLQPIVSHKNKLDSKGIETGIFQEKEGEKYLLGKLVATYDPENWSARDYGKPRSDKYSGMMPPKLARMLINISLGDISPDQQFSMTNKCEGDAINENRNDVVVVDPFCGSGNVLIEALELGLPVIGSDISEKAVEDTKTNLNWLLPRLENNKSETKNQNTLFDMSDKIFQADATKDELIKKINLNLLKKSESDVGNLIIVSEPYLGKPKKSKPDKEDLEEEILQLKKLYLDFLSNAKKVGPDRLKNICLVFPLFELKNDKKLSLYDESVDEIKKLGYTPTRNLIYGRDYQVVKREMVFLSLENN